MGNQPVVLFNCTINVLGGGIKNSALFIVETLLNPSGIQWKYAISPQVADVLRGRNINLGDDFFIFESTPARSLKARKELSDLAVATRASLIYTMAGPAYVKFKTFHLMGISNPYVTHVDLDVFKANDLITNLKLIPVAAYQFLKSRKADHYVFQTETARKSFCKRTRTKQIKTTVVSNAFDSNMRTFFDAEDYPFKKQRDIVNIFCPGAPYPHKAFQFIPELAKALQKIIKTNFKFTLTLSDSPVLELIKKKSQKLGVEKYIYNRGPYGYNELASVYSDADIVYVPSLLETFSATYLEAICSNKILIAANKDFASEVCGEYAIYIDPLNYKESSKIFQNVIENIEEYAPDKELGNVLLDKFGDQNQRYNSLVKLIKRFID